MSQVITRVDQIEENFVAHARVQSKREAIVMCPPDYFRVIDVKNAHMEGQIGKVDKDLAVSQWKNVKRQVEEKGFQVFTVPATEGLEDMVFTANPAFVGENSEGERVALLSSMKHASRKKEVAAFDAWFTEKKYKTASLSKEDWVFEGNGDGIWQWDRSIIWGGYGFRTELEAYEEISNIFGAPVIAVQLTSPYFYHLDTCFCPLSEKVVLIYPGAFDEKGLALILSLIHISEPTDRTRSRMPSSA